MSSTPTGHVASCECFTRDHHRLRCDYALEFVGPAPLPPHERAWRHPSELALSKADVEESTGSGGGFVLATGVAVVMLAAVMVVALTPPRSDAPNAVGATTLPPVTVQLRSAPVQDLDTGATARTISTGTVMIDHSIMSRDNALALVGAPNAISAAPADPTALGVGQQLPDDAERVYLLTHSHTYSVVWSQIDRVTAPDGSAVVTTEGELIASFEAGELRILVD